MTEIPLICHPQSDAGSIERIDVSLTRGAGGKIELTYRIFGELDALKIASPKMPIRADGLWKTTCFELFIGSYEDETYLEYNFAPSGQWAAYQFSGYRADIADLVTCVPDIKVEHKAGVCIFSVMLKLPNAWRQVTLRAGISAVMAPKSGDISYWAAAHPPGKPDFHHKDCFAVHLEAPSAA